MYLYRYDCYVDDDLVIYRTRDNHSSRAGCLYQPKINLSSNGYPQIGCCVNGRNRTVSVHRIIAEAFIPNPENLPTVDHINRDKLDYRVENLRWADFQTQNNNRSFVISSQGKYGWKGAGREPKTRYLEINRNRMRNYRDTHVRVYLPNGTRRFVLKEHTVIIPYNVPVGFKHVLKPEYIHMYVKGVDDGTAES